MFHFSKRSLKFNTKVTQTYGVTTIKYKLIYAIFFRLRFEKRAANTTHRTVLPLTLPFTPLCRIFDKVEPYAFTSFIAVWEFQSLILVLIL